MCSKVPTCMRLYCSARWCETTISAAEPCCSNVHVGEHERDSEQHQFLNHSRPSHSIPGRNRANLTALPVSHGRRARAASKSRRAAVGAPCGRVFPPI